MSFGGIVRLSVHTALIATIVFFVWVIGRTLALAADKRRGAPPPDKRREAMLWVFVFYVIFLYQITVFRYGINPALWRAWQEPFESINLTPFVHTIKLYYAYTKWFFVYNLLGNILWFVPLGAMLPTLTTKSGRRRGFWMTSLIGLCCSLSIEILQFVFATGISDVDDLIFNTLGTMAGYIIFLCVRTGYRAACSRHHR